MGVSALDHDNEMIKGKTKYGDKKKQLRKSHGNKDVA